VSNPALNACKLTPDQVLRVLTDPMQQHALAVELGVSDTTIYRVRSGFSYQHLHPGVPRPTAPDPTLSCTMCVHFSGDRCQMAFPEFRSKQTYAAGDCAAYMEGAI